MAFFPDFVSIVEVSGDVTTVRETGSTIRRARAFPRVVDLKLAD
ncbi:MAG: hypothetical protein R3C40_03675 [Parvularculaceae bacterium]